VQGPDASEILNALLPGIPVTLFLTGLGLVVGFVLGLGLALLRIYSKDWAFVAVGYEKVVRGIPLLVIIYIFYFGFPQLFGLLPALLRPFFSASFALGITSAAYQSQIFRGAILSVDPSQAMAARAVGMTNYQTQVHIVLPQAFRIALSSWTNEYAVVIKDASFASVIGVADMVRLANNVTATSPAARFLAMIIVAAIYLLLTYPVTNFLGERQTKKLRKLGMGGK
jgi:polar amino acid transport system permease protein